MSSKRKTSAMAVAGVGQDVDGSAVKKRKLTVRVTLQSLCFAMRLASCVLGVVQSIAKGSK